MLSCQLVSVPPDCTINVPVPPAWLPMVEPPWMVVPTTTLPEFATTTVPSPWSPTFRLVVLASIVLPASVTTSVPCAPAVPPMSSIGFDPSKLSTVKLLPPSMVTTPVPTLPMASVPFTCIEAADSTSTVPVAPASSPTNSPCNSPEPSGAPAISVARLETVTVPPPLSPTSSKVSTNQFELPSSTRALPCASPLKPTLASQLTSVPPVSTDRKSTR